MEVVTANGLTHTVHPDGSFICEELQRLPETFAERFTVDGVKAMIEAQINRIGELAFLVYESKEQRDAEQHDAEATRRRNQAGREIFDREVAKIDISHLSLFQQFLYWFGDWWYVHPMKMQVRFRNTDKIRDCAPDYLSPTILSILPVSLRKVVENMELANTAVAYGHFALMFVDHDKRFRRIITDTQLFEIRGVYGYIYLDVTPNGKPLARSRCDKGGERAFFDGVHLMAHPRFQTCAPWAVMLNGSGYKVNSTQCTIVNGQLFPLIDVDDRVAHTTGEFMGYVDFSARDQVEADTLAKQSAARMQVVGDKVFLDGTELKPLGRFAPSETTITETGFVHYNWSTFEPIMAARYPRILVVDDNEEWTTMVVRNFQKHCAVQFVVTSNASHALQVILTINPPAVLLDMHLTEDERFDGLWIANQLAAHNFAGDILITSSYPEPHLRAMQQLIRRNTEAPGKNIERLHKLLLVSEPGC